MQKQPDRPVSQYEYPRQKKVQHPLAQSRGNVHAAGSNQRNPSQFIPQNQYRQNPFFPRGHKTPIGRHNFPNQGPQSQFPHKQSPQRGRKPTNSLNPNVRALQGNQRQYVLSKHPFRGQKRIISAKSNEGKSKVVRKVISGKFNSRESLKLGITKDSYNIRPI